MFLQITYHDKAAQNETKGEDTIEKIFEAITTLRTKVDSMDNEIQKLKTNEDNLKSKSSISQQHDNKNAKLCQSEDKMKSRAKRDVGKHLKIHNNCINTFAGPSQRVSERHTNSNLIFRKTIYLEATQKNLLTTKSQTSTYADSVHHE